MRIRHPSELCRPSDAVDFRGLPPGVRIAGTPPPALAPRVGTVGGFTSESRAESRRLADDLKVAAEIKWLQTPA